LGEQDLGGFVFLSTTHSAYEHLILKKPNGSAMIPSQAEAMDAAHPVDLILVTPPSQEEKALAAAEGVELVMKPVCCDAFVFITHADNPVQSLTVQQIRDIYSGKITNWQELGGGDTEIDAYQRPVNSGSQTAMIQLVMEGQPIYGAVDQDVEITMEDLVRRVGEYHNNIASIGYTYQFYLDSLYRDENIKVLAVEGVAPEPQNLRSGQYPFATHYYGVIRGGEEGAAGGRFLDWLVSEEGQRCVAQAGYIPMNEP
jgi:phosphate transport system substrate-binding protein